MLSRSKVLLNETALAIMSGMVEKDETVSKEYRFDGNLLQCYNLLPEAGPNILVSPETLLSSYDSKKEMLLLEESPSGDCLTVAASSDEDKLFR